MLSGLPWGLALSSGINTYLPLFLVALFARFSHLVHLSPRFQFLVSNECLVILGALAACEILAEKFPGLDNVWDFVHTLLRPLAGAVAAGAALSTDRVFETVIAMLMGATLATAAHSAKTSLRLASTSKTLGAANPILSLGEDAAVIFATLTSVFAPWVMLAFVVVFTIIFALFGPRLFRAMLFELHVVASWFGWLWKKVTRVPEARELKESLFEIDPRRLRVLSRHLADGQELRGVLEGWTRSKSGPRRTWLLATDRHLVLIERRLLRRAKVRSLSISKIAAVRARNLILYTKVELLTRQNENYTLNLRKTHGQLGSIAVAFISQAVALFPVESGILTLPNPRLAPISQ